MKKWLYPLDSSNFLPLHKEIPPTVLTVTLLFKCISYVCWREKNDIMLSNVVETKTEVSKVSKWRRNGARSRCAFPPSDLLQNKSLNLTIGYIGKEC